MIWSSLGRYEEARPATIPLTWSTLLLSCGISQIESEGRSFIFTSLTLLWHDGVFRVGSCTLLHNNPQELFLPESYPIGFRLLQVQFTRRVTDGQAVDLKPTLLHHTFRF